MIERRVYGSAWAAAGLAWVVNALTGLDAADRSAEFYRMEAVFIPVHVLVLVGIVGLLRANVTGHLRWGRWGLYLAVLGRILFLAGEVVAVAVGYDDEVVLLPIAAISTAVGMTVAGIATVRAQHWTGWQRLAPLVMGIYPLVLMFPVLAVSGHRPNLLVSLWGLTYLIIAAAVATSVPGSRLATTTRAEAGTDLTGATGR